MMGATENIAKILNQLGGVEGIGQLIGNVGGGVSAGAEREALAQQLAYLSQERARSAYTNFLTGQMDDQLARAQALGRQLPLGAEQALVQQNAKQYQTFRSLAGRPTPAGYGGIYNPAVGMDLRPWGQESTAAGLAQNRNIAAALSPGMQFSPMSALGLDSSVTAPYDFSVGAYQQSVAQTRAAQEQALAKALEAQLAASMGASPVGAMQSLQQQKKGGGFWKTLGKIGLAAAPIVAGAVGGPLGSVVGRAVVGGLSGIGQSKLSGAGWGQALTSGGLGAVTGAMTPTAGVRGPGEAVGAAVKRAVLNPRALTTIGSAALPDQARMVAQAITPMFNLRGPALYSLPTPASQTMALAQGPQVPAPQFDLNAPPPTTVISEVPWAGMGPTNSRTFQQLYGPPPTGASPTVRAISPAASRPGAEISGGQYFPLPVIPGGQPQRGFNLPASQPSVAARPVASLTDDEALAIYNSPYFNQLILLPQVNAQLAEYAQRKAAQRQQFVNEATRGASMASGGR